VPASTKSYSAREFIDRLRRGDTLTPFRLSGIVKLDPVESSQMHFAIGTACENWIAIPVDLIETIAVEDIVTCGGDTYPLVQLELKEPASDDGAVFATVARALYQLARSLSAQVMSLFDEETLPANNSNPCATCLRGCKGVPAPDVFDCIARCGSSCPG
jgi:hypothetical protein